MEQDIDPITKASIFDTLWAEIVVPVENSVIEVNIIISEACSRRNMM